MDNEQEMMELDRAYREYAEMQEKLERRFHEDLAAAGLISTSREEAVAKMFDHFFGKIRPRG